MQTIEKLEKKSSASEFNQSAIPDNWKGLGIEQFGWEQFQRGEAHQQEKAQTEFKSVLTKNLNLAAVLSEGIFHTAIRDHAVDMIKVFLKPETIHQYEALFLVGREDYLSDKLRGVYAASHQVKTDFNGEDFYISFKFIPYSEDLNMNSIYNDGFILAYDGERKQEPVACQA